MSDQHTPARQKKVHIDTSGIIDKHQIYNTEKGKKTYFTSFTLDPVVFYLMLTREDYIGGNILLIPTKKTKGKTVKKSVPL
jgi:hypothetical protein